MTPLMWVTDQGFMLLAVDQDRLEVVAHVFDLRSQPQPRISISGTGTCDGYRRDDDEKRSYGSLKEAMDEVERRHALREVAA